MQAIADFDRDWASLSDQHDDLVNDIDEITETFAGGEELDLYSCAIIGVFGAGKTQLLYKTAQLCLEKDIVPLYFEADRLFEDVFNMDSPAPKDVTEVVNNTVDSILDAIEDDDEQRLRKLLNPANELDQEQIVELILEQHGGTRVERHAVLVDELEQQYGELQDHVRAEQQKNSPLRDWLEGKRSLKFTALAPAGIYEMGGADQTRCRRLVIPPADVKHIRQTFFSGDAGATNACWWLSRGNPRHIIKNLDKLADAKSKTKPTEIHSFLQSLDQVGQDPSRVPAVAIDSEAISPAEYEHLVDLKPISAEEQKRFVIDTETLDEAQFITGAKDAFNIDETTAIYLARYFFTILNALSEDDGMTYIEQDDISELFSIAFDFLLEYQHNNPDLKDSLRGLSERYTDVGNADLVMLMSEIGEYKETAQALPISIGTIREIFPLPIVDPIVKGHSPSDIRDQYEGNGLPIWELKTGNITTYVFLSVRDFEEYASSDEFENAVIPDGSGALCLVCQGKPTLNDSTLEWYAEHDKLEVTGTSPLLADFLTSLVGESSSNIPANLGTTIDELLSANDPILGRKVKIYQESFENVNADNLPEPVEFCPHPPKNTNVWGGDQQSNRDIVIPACAVAFCDLTTEEQRLLHELGNLFQSGGALTFIAKNRGGYQSMARDMFPHETAQGGYDHQNVIKNIKGYFTAENKLRHLARMVSEDTFRKISENEDKDRLLTALWRAERNEFGSHALDRNLTWLRDEAMNTLNQANSLEDDAIDLGIKAIDWEDHEEYVAAYANGDLKSLVDLAESSRTDADDLVQVLYAKFIGAARDDSTMISKFNGTISDAQLAMDNFTQAGENLKKNLLEYRKAREYADTDEEEIEDTIAQQTPTGTIEISDFETTLSSSKNTIQKFSTDLKTIEGHLDEIENEFEEIADIKAAAAGDDNE